MIDRRKVVIVGTGFVGMSMAYTILNRGGINELVLIDIAKDKTIGEAMDLSHGLPFSPGKLDIKAGDYPDCGDADIVVITAGVPQKPGETRLDLAKTNTKIIKEITQSVVGSGFKGIFIIASNPVDLMSYVVQKTSGFPKERVIGSGTLLDTARLRYIIGEKIGVSSKNIHAYIMGEHGDSSFVPWTHCYVGGKSLIEIYNETGRNISELEQIHTEVVNAAYEIINRKKATYYGIGIALTRLVMAILNNENSILPVSTLQNGEYGQEGIFIGVPAVVNGDGVREILKLKLNEEEQAKFDNSANTLREMIKNEIDKIIEE